MVHATSAHWRNLAVCGHASAGKTTLVNRLLAAAARRSGSPPSATNFTCDFEPEEKSHGYTIDSAIVNWELDGRGFNVIDTPGYGDFIGALVGAIAAVDAAVICVSAREGLQAATRRAMQEAEKAKIPAFIVVTKLDDAQSNFSQTVERCQSAWGSRAVPVQVPIGQGDSFSDVVSLLKLPEEARGAVINAAHAHEQLVEKLVETDESLMLQYFDGVMPEPDKLRQLLHDAVVAGEIIPILCVSAEKEVGLDALLDAIAELAPAPEEIPRQARDAEGNPVTLEQSPEAPLAAQVFKVRVDPFVQRVSYLRIFGGKFCKDAMLPVSGHRKEVKISQPMLVCGEQLTPVDEAVAGQIVAVTKMDELHLGTSLGTMQVPPIEFPKPMVGVAITPTRHGDETKLSVALHKLAEEDPTVKLSNDPQTGEWILSGTSGLHLQILRERMLRRDKLEIDTHDPHIPYRETVTQSAEGSYRHKKQSGGRGQFGEVHLRLMPLPRGTKIESFATKDRFPSMKTYHYHKDANFLWVDSVVGGAIPGNFMPAIEKGFLECLHCGALAGYPIQDVAVEVFFGKHHPVDSSETAFRIAASHALRQVFAEARPALLEPIARVTVLCPDAAVGDIYGDMSSRGGRVLGTEAAPGAMQSIECEVPLRCISHYDRTLSSATAGQGTYSLELSHYEVVPREVATEIIRTAKQPASEAAPV